MCPCKLLRAGAFLWIYCFYALAWPRVFFGDAWSYVVIDKIKEGDVFNARGLLVLAVSLAVHWTVRGIEEALGHTDKTEWRGVVWSVCVIALGVHALNHGWMSNGSALSYHASRAAWFAWIASNAANLVLQFRGQFLGLLRRRRDPVPSQEVGFVSYDTTPNARAAYQPQPVPVPIYPAYEPQPVLTAHWRQTMQTIHYEWEEAGSTWARTGQPFFLQSVNDDEGAFLSLPSAWQSKVIADDWAAMTWQEKADYLLAVKERDSQGRKGWLLPSRDQEGQIVIREIPKEGRPRSNLVHLPRNPRQ